MKNGPSPDWLQRRLKAIGLRPISTLVDITNLVTFDLNRPLHVFDAKKLSGDLVMRQARESETILALDGKTYTLDPSVSVIADSKAAHGIGGVMGGEETGVQANTTEVFLEVAYFTPIKVAATGRKPRHTVRRALSLRARHRSAVGRVGHRRRHAPDLELCGGEASEITRSGVMPDWERSYTLRADRVKTLTAIDVPAQQTADILGKLGFGITGNGPWTAAVPSWRPDIIGEADWSRRSLACTASTTSRPRRCPGCRPPRSPYARRCSNACRKPAGRWPSAA